MVERLTKAQRELLAEIREGVTDDGPGIYIRSQSRWSRTVAVLARLGLIEKVGHDYDGIGYWRPVSDKGRYD